MSKKKDFDLHFQYQLYLSRVGLKESTMHPQQKIETKRTFFGAFGQAIILLRDEVAAEPDEDKAVDILQDLMNQVQDFFLAETKRQN